MTRMIPIAVLLLSLAACGHDSGKKSQTPPAAPVTVKVLTVTGTDLPAVYEAVGTVKARTAATISSRVMGYVRDVRVAVGDRVRAGQLLVTIDSRELEAVYGQAEAARAEAQSAIAEVENSVSAAKANLELSQVTFNRMKDLFEKRSISNQEYDEAAARLEVAKANLQMAQSKRTQLAAKVRQADAAVRSAGIVRGYAQITAPFAGVVTEKHVDPGNLASPGAPLLTVEQAGAYRLEVPVEESRLGSIQSGRPVEVVLDALNQRLQARVSEIVPAIDAASRTFLVKIDLPRIAHLGSGLYGRAVFQSGVRRSIVVPADAVIQRGQVLSVLVADDGIARTRLVTTGRERDGRIEILTGLVQGEKLIYPVPPSVLDGARVEVQP
ncbi:MAG TPA: efflux RND transporter periplasmic adaptor subunit [Bryobacteraceae bacterium]|nr:efflux RND transporter periplasmic adaptor subunit [Bryobacteraceae bacterium]